MSAFLLDLRQALRALLKAPAFTVTAVLTLALGIGANTAMFSAIRGLLLKPLPYRDPGALVALWETRPAKGEARFPLSTPNFFDWKDRATRTFEGMSVVNPITFDLAGNGDPRRVSALQVSPGFFELLGAHPRLGTTFNPDMDLRGREKVVVLGHGLWRGQFGSDPAVLGRSITLSGEPHTILGVMPAGFLYPSESTQDLYLPLVRPATGEDRGSHGLRAFGRLRPGVALAAAQSELSAIAQDLEKLYPQFNEGSAARVLDLRGDLLGDGSKPLLLLLGAVGLLLLIACTNVANLFLTRAIAREKEVAIRASLGASRRQLLSLFLAEGLVTGLAGALLGLGVAALALRALPSILPNTGDLNQIQSLALDPWALAFTLGVSLATSLLFGLVPAWQTREVNLNEGLRSGAKGSAASGRLRSALVVGEVALAMLLLLSTGLLLRSFVKVMGTHPGFESKGVTAFELDLPARRYAQESQQEAFRLELERRLAQLPGVSAVGSALMAPLSGGNMTTSVNVGPTDAPSSRWSHRAAVNIVSPGFFESLRIPLRQGRTLLPSDDARGRRVVVVNETLARTFFPEGRAVGRQLLVGVSGEITPKRTPWEIVGVVGDVRHRSLEQAPTPALLMPCAQMPIGTFAFFLRSPAPFPALNGAIRQQVRGLDGEVALDRFEPFENQVRKSLGDRRQTLVLLATFAGLALLLAGIGIYGVVAYGVTQRTREIGIRMALGAQIREVLSLVLGQGLRLTLGGVALGALAALFTGRLLASQLVGLGSMDPLTCLGVAALLCAVALLACLAPALRAARVDPAITLRSE